MMDIEEASLTAEDRQDIEQMRDEDRRSQEDRENIGAEEEEDFYSDLDSDSYGMEDDEDDQLGDFSDEGAEGYYNEDEDEEMEDEYYDAEDLGAEEGELEHWAGSDDRGD